MGVPRRLTVGLLHSCALRRSRTHGQITMASRKTHFSSDSQVAAADQLAGDPGLVRTFPSPSLRNALALEPGRLPDGPTESAHE